MKVAQYEVLGWRLERVTRPGRDDRICLLAPVKPYVRDEEPNVSIVPAGTDISFWIISQHFVLDYFHCVLRDAALFFRRPRPPRRTGYFHSVPPRRIYPGPGTLNTYRRRSPAQTSLPFPIIPEVALPTFLCDQAIATLEPRNSQPATPNPHRWNRFSRRCANTRSLRSF